MTKRYEIVETVDHEFIVLVDGLQWGEGPRDKSGASSQTWPTREAAQAAITADDARELANRRAWLVQHGYVAGPRDARLNTNYQGRFMVTEAEYEDYELPTEDGANGPWCIVGDDLDALIHEAFYALS